jgi:hypothetical protein
MESNLTLDDAASTLSYAEECLRDERLRAKIDVEDVIAAGARLSEEVTRLKNELERASVRARAAAMRAGHRDVAGHELIRGWHHGAERDLLDGHKVHAGTGLYLLTMLGWMPWRYESSCGPDGERQPRFYFGLPGCWRDLSIRIESCMRVAWPEDVR